MIKEVKEVDKERGIMRVTIADERWYGRQDKQGNLLWVPSVTWICDSYPKGVGFYKWLANHGWDEAEAIKTTAGDRGTKVHDAISDVLAGVEVRIDSKYMNKSKGVEEELSLEECQGILSFVNFKKLANPKSLAWDVALFSEKYNYAGTIDWACKFPQEAYKILDIPNYSENDFWIVDFKTSQDVWPTHEIQVNAYKQAQVETNEVTGIPKKANIRMAILQVGYRRNKKFWKFTEIEEKFDLFMHARAIWQNEHGGEKPNLLEFPIVLSEKLTVDNVLNNHENEQRNSDESGNSAEVEISIENGQGSAGNGTTHSEDVGGQTGKRAAPRKRKSNSKGKVLRGGKGGKKDVRSTAKNDGEKSGE